MRCLVIPRAPGASRAAGVRLILALRRTRTPYERRRHDAGWTVAYDDRDWHPLVGERYGMLWAEHRLSLLEL